MHCDDNDLRNKNNMVSKEEAEVFLSKSNLTIYMKVLMR